MSTLGALYSADAAFERAKEVRAKKEVEFYAMIDKDVQKLVEKVNDQIDNELPSKDGIYTFEVLKSSINYKPKKRILERFDEKMSKFYCVTYVYKRSLLKGERKWIVQFRPKSNDERVKGNTF